MSRCPLCRRYCEGLRTAAPWSGSIGAEVLSGRGAVLSTTPALGQRTLLRSSSIKQRSPSGTLTELARYIRVNRSAQGEIIGRMEERSLVVRRRLLKKRQMVSTCELRKSAVVTVSAEEGRDGGSTTSASKSSPRTIGRSRRVSLGTFTWRGCPPRTYPRDGVGRRIAS
jgi:hypothetical protein